VQVLRLQPGDQVTLFNGDVTLADQGAAQGEFEATVTAMGRSHVTVEVGSFLVADREAARAVHLAVGMPANERMDWLVEKATELGVMSIQPLMTERSVLRLSGDRAAKKVAHWQSIAVAACEQSGRNRVPQVHGVMTLAQWLATRAIGGALGACESTLHCLLSLQPQSVSPMQLLAQTPREPTSVTFLSGPEGGLSPAEEQAAQAQQFAPVTLGPRVLRAETAALAALVALTLPA
jgi:16S rRNA (uracil1498-N3)-methyltransferase